MEMMPRAEACILMSDISAFFVLGIVRDCLLLSLSPDILGKNHPSAECKLQDLGKTDSFGLRLS